MLVIRRKLRKKVNNMTEEWEEVPAMLDIWLPEASGETLQGVVLEKKDGQYGPQWLIKTSSGDFWTPSHKVLQARMNSVPIGDEVRIERTESLPPKVRGQNPTTMYRVSVRKK
jgi:hypothetical protein